MIEQRIRRRVVQTLTFALASLCGASAAPAQSDTKQEPTDPAPEAPQLPAKNTPIRSGITIAAAHQLRRAIPASSQVLIGKPEGIEAFGERFLLHKVRVLHTLKGSPIPTPVVRIVQIRGITTHVEPGRTGPRLYCLRPLGADADRLGLPGDRQPYFRLNGHQGSHPRLDPATEGPDPSRDPLVALTQALVAGESGQPLEATRDALLALAMHPDPIARFEATMALAEREALHRRIDMVRMANLLNRCAGETDDLVYRIALAELCATRKNPGVVEALCMGLDRIEDLGYARSAGRIAGYVAGDRVTEILNPRIRHVSSDIERGRLLVMLGASGAESGLKLLLEHGRSRPNTPMLREALLANGRPQAVALAKRLPAHGRGATPDSSKPKRPESQPTPRPGGTGG